MPQWSCGVFSWPWGVLFSEPGAQGSSQPTCTCCHAAGLSQRVYALPGGGCIVLCCNTLPETHHKAPMSVPWKQTHRTIHSPEECSVCIGEWWSEAPSAVWVVDLGPRPAYKVS